jgi:hypothetical protein
MPNYRRVLAFSSALACLAANPAGATPPARVDCEVLENGKPSLGSYRLLSGETQIAKGGCGRPADAPAGKYELAITLDGAVDTPVFKQPVELRVGELVKAKATFETGEILVELTRDGHRTVGTIKLLRGKDTVATLTAGVASRVSVGTYGVELESRGTRRTLDAVAITRGERRSLREDFSSSAQARP